MEEQITLRNPPYSKTCNLKNGVKPPSVLAPLILVTGPPIHPSSWPTGQCWVPGMQWGKPWDLDSMESCANGVVISATHPQLVKRDGRGWHLSLCEWSFEKHLRIGHESWWHSSGYTRQRGCRVQALGNTAQTPSSSFPWWGLYHSKVSRTVKGVC